MPTLVEIADLERIVLFDASVLSLKDLRENPRGSEKYADLDRGLLMDFLQNSEEFLEFIQQGNTFTVENAIQDFKNLQKIMSNKQRFLNERQKLIPTKYAEKGETKELLFRNISDNIFNILRLARLKVFKPEEKDIYETYYEALPYFFDLVQAVPTGDEKERYRQLYATAIYLSLYKKMPVALAIKSTQFLDGLISLVKGFSMLLEETPHLQQCPIKLYFERVIGNYEVIYSTQHEKPTQRINP